MSYDSLPLSESSYAFGTTLTSEMVAPLIEGAVSSVELTAGIYQHIGDTSGPSLSAGTYYLVSSVEEVEGESYLRYILRSFSFSGYQHYDHATFHPPDDVSAKEVVAYFTHALRKIHFQEAFGFYGKEIVKGMFGVFTSRLRQRIACEQGVPFSEVPEEEKRRFAQVLLNHGLCPHLGQNRTLLGRKNLVALILEQGRYETHYFYTTPAEMRNMFEELHLFLILQGQ